MPLFTSGEWPTASLAIPPSAGPFVLIVRLHGKSDQSAGDHQQQSEARALERAVQYARAEQGPGAYEAAYNTATALRRAALSDEVIRAQLIQPVKALANESVPLLYRQLYAVHRALTAIRQQAVEDALAGRSPQFKP